MLGRASVFACDTRGVRDAVERLHGGVSDKGTPKIRDGELAGLLRAPMNKMDVLASAGRVFAPSRRVLSWASVIRRSAHAGDVRIMVNLGAAIRTGADGRHADLPDGARRLIGALLFRGLKDEIVASCAGWQARGRAARILVDELTDVLGADGDTGGGNADILAWLREKGRAYGVQLVAGTQNAVQLEGGLLASVTGLMTVGTFVLRADLTAGPSAVAVGSGSGDGARPAVAHGAGAHGRPSPGHGGPASHDPVRPPFRRGRARVTHTRVANRCFVWKGHDGEGIGRCEGVREHGRACGARAGARQPVCRVGCRG